MGIVLCAVTIAVCCVMLASEETKAVKAPSVAAKVRRVRQCSCRNH